MRSFQRSLTGVVCFGFAATGLLGCSSGTPARYAGQHSSQVPATQVDRVEVAEAVEPTEVRFSSVAEPKPTPTVLPQAPLPVTHASYAVPTQTGAASLVQDESNITPEVVASWAQAGARDDVIIDRIERSDAIIRLTAGDEVRLRRQGVSEDVICAIKETARR